MNLVSAILIKKVRFLDFKGNWIDLDVDTEIVLDLKNHIACVDDLYFDISWNEYNILN